MKARSAISRNCGSGSKKLIKVFMMDHLRVTVLETHCSLFSSIYVPSLQRFYCLIGLSIMQNDIEGFDL